MNTPQTTGDQRLQDSPDFSLVLGGPLYQLWRRAHLTGNGLELLHRRVFVFTIVAWLPLFIFSAAEGHLWNETVQLPFIKDIEMHARLLVALPLLVFAELLVHQRLCTLVQQFLERGLIPEAARAKFDLAVASASRLRDTVTAEVLLIAFVYIVGVGFIWRTHVALDVPSWYGEALNGRLQPSLAGWWMGLVSLPLFQFLLLRWYFRLFIWARFLWQISRLELKTIPTHPDGCGGLGFLAGVSQAFAPLLLAQGVVLAGMISNRVFFSGAKLPEFKLEVIGLVAVLVFAILGPLLVFSPKLERTRRAGLKEYGALAQRYGREFEQKWLRGGARPDEPLIGSADIQSLADFGNSFQTVKGMQSSPFGARSVIQLAITTLLPITPLLLTIFPLDELLTRLIKIVF